MATRTVVTALIKQAKKLPKELLPGKAKDSQRAKELNELSGVRFAAPASGHR
jgi:hypothetical protein